MHQGCFVWTLTPPLFGSEDVVSGSPVCVRVRSPVSWVSQPASQARFGAPHPFLWPGPVLALFAPPLRAGVALFVVVAVFFLFFLSSPFVCPRCLWRSVFSGRDALGLGSSCPPAPSPTPLFFCYPLPSLFFFSFAAFP